MQYDLMIITDNGNDNDTHVPPTPIFPWLDQSDNPYIICIVISELSRDILWSQFKRFEWVIIQSFMRLVILHSFNGITRNLFLYYI